MNIRDILLVKALINGGGSGGSCNTVVYTAHIEHNTCVFDSATFLAIYNAVKSGKAAFVLYRYVNAGGGLQDEYIYRTAPLRVERRTSNEADVLSIDFIDYDLEYTQVAGVSYSGLVNGYAHFDEPVVLTTGG